MAKRKRARATARKAAKTAQGAGRLRRARPVRRVAKKAVQKKDRRKAAVRKKALRRSTKSAGPAARKRVVSKASRTKKTSKNRTRRGEARKKAVVVRRALKKPVLRKKPAVAAKPEARRPVVRQPKRPATPPSTAGPTAKAHASPAPRRARPAATQVARAGKPPALNRARRTVSDEDFAPSPPSSLDLDRTASAARSGRQELADKFQKHTETSPVLTGGDVDGDWESAYSVGDEAPGGDNPTPDQTVVDDIGSALGVVYEDDEELTSEKKISDRDKHRWELDPESSDDYDER
jgi:hypothetical protein